jgi:hypothetical protein
MNCLGGDTTTSDDSLSSFKEKVKEKIKAEEDLIPQLGWDPRKNRIGLVVIAALLIISFVAILLRPYGSYIWLLISFILVSFAWLLLFLPTTKKERGYWKHRRSLNEKSKGSKSKSLKTIAKRRKRLLAEVWINAFFYGNAIPTFAFLLIFGLSIFFSLYHGYVVEDLSIRNTWIIVIQCVAIIGFHGYLYVYRPFAKSMFSMPKDFKGRVGEAHRRNSLAVAGVILFIALFIALFSFLIILGMLLPGTTLDKVRDFLTANGGANTYTIVLMAIIQYIVLRYFQSTTSSRMGLKVVNSQLARLKKNVLAPLEEIMAEGASGKSFDSERLNQVKAEFYQICINRLYRHDYFGKVPIFFINPDMRLLMREDVLEILDKAGGTG